MISKLEQSQYLDINLHFHDSTDTIITSKIELLIQEIELAIKIGPEELWGVKYSLNTERYIFNQYITLNQIKNELSTFIALNCEHAQYFKIDYAIKVTNVESKDLIYMLIEVKELTEKAETVKLEFLIGNWE